MAACSAFSIGISTVMANPSPGPQACQEWGFRHALIPCRTTCFGLLLPAILCNYTKLVLYMSCLSGMYQNGLAVRGNEWLGFCDKSVSITELRAWFFMLMTAKCRWSLCVRRISSLLPLSSAHYNLIKTEIIMRIRTRICLEHTWTEVYLHYLYLLSSSYS